jgi:hypothetical protein
MTKDPHTPTRTPAETPTKSVPEDNHDEMSKARDFRDPGDKKHGQDPEDVAERMGSTGRESGIK